MVLTVTRRDRHVSMCAFVDVVYMFMIDPLSPDKV